MARKRQVVAFDVETTGLRPYHGDKIFAWATCDESGDIKVSRLDSGATLASLQSFFDDTSIAKVAHNAKFEMSMLDMCGINIPKNTIWHDTMLMVQEIKNDLYSYKLEDLCWTFGGYSRALDTEVHQKGREYGGFQRVPKPLMSAYQWADVERTMLLYKLFWPKIRADADLLQDYLVEIALLNPTRKMEKRGIMIHIENINNKLIGIDDRLYELQEHVRKEYGSYINLGSSKQIARLLFDRLSFPVIAKTKSGAPKCDKDVLMQLRETNPHPVLETLQEYRSLVKGRGAIDGYARLADKNDVLHSEIKTNYDITGREASENPNLQNVSKPKNVKNPYIVPARDCFRPRPGHVFFLVDQSGIEMRLIASTANEKEMLDMFARGESPHEAATALFYSGIPGKYKGKKETKELYDAGKNAHFAKAYGCTLIQFAKTLGITVDQARVGWLAYEARFPKVSTFSKSQEKQVREYGYVATAFGRKLSVPKNKPYVASNWIIQGTAAGILKRGQVACDALLYKYPGAYIILPIHDEIIFEYPLSLWGMVESFYNDMSQAMTVIDGIKVKLEVEWKYTKTTWDRAESFDLSMYKETA